MGHLKVRRGSIPIEQWIKLVFKQVDEFIIDEEYDIDGWEIRNAEYKPTGYLWHDDFHSIQQGDLWGGPDVTSVFRCNVTIPKNFSEKNVYFYMHTASEVIVTEEGQYLAGLDPNRKYFKLIDKEEVKQNINLQLEAYTRSKPDDERNTDVSSSLVGCAHYFERPKLVTINDEFLSLKYDLKAIYDAGYAELIDTEVKEFLQYHMEELLKLFPPYGSGKDAFIKRLPIINEYINKNIYGNYEHLGKKGNVALVGHSHLDIAYHWRVDQTVQKNARTTLIQLNLMDQYPDFKYSHSQAWVYESLETYHPELFQKVKQKIIDGQWEIVGGMYVEPDCNLINIESFTRQILYGKKYFKEKFNVDVDNAWLPDVFGNSAIMPQVLKQGGINYFVTHKLSVWNDTNKFPHSHFKWRGIDGSEVNTCVPPIHFVTWMDTDETIKNWKEFTAKNYSDETLQLYGYGDGGSGVTDEMLELYERQQKLPGIPKQRLSTAKDFLYSAFSKSSDYPMWDGELYLEMHRGTFTTKGDIKKQNRFGEFESQRVETLCTLVDILHGDYNQQRNIDELWKKLLLNQFHDILPGSHTHPVGLDALETYTEMFTGYKQLEIDALTKIAKSSDSRMKNYYAFNFLSDARNYHIYIAACHWEDQYNALIDSKNNIFPVQKITKANGDQEYIAEINSIPGLSLTNFKAGNMNKNDVRMKVSKHFMENDFYRIDFSETGKIVHLYDKKRNKTINADNEIVNDWVIYEDKPGALNAWDIVRTYKNQFQYVSDWSNIQVVEEGPVCSAVRMEKKFSNSRAVQIIRIYNNKPQIDFDTWVDWNEEEKLLKVNFPVNVKSRSYTTDTSAGGYERVNHRNTSWEQSQFEVPCHKFVDMSEGQFGVSILNDCKYGCDVEGNSINLSLLKSPIYPDTTSDVGEHNFTYSLYTHDGSWQNSELTELAYDMNAPLYLGTGKKVDEYSALVNDVQAIKCQAFKLADDGSGDIIVRFAEVLGSHGVSKIKFNFDVEEVEKVDVLENFKCKESIIENTVELSFKQYELINLRLKRPN